MKPEDIEHVLDEIEKVLSGLHEYQTNKARQIAHRIRPDLTSEDLLNPDNFSELISDPNFMYEDGIAAGILAAKMALRARLRELGASS